MRAEHELDGADALVTAAVHAAEAAAASCLAAYTKRGVTAQRVSRERPLQPIVALTTSLGAARRLALVWGLEARVVPDIRDPEDIPKVACAEAMAAGVVGPAQRIVVLAGLPMGSPGAANILRLAHTPRR
jgi:pyruvate kinase